MLLRTLFAWVVGLIVTIIVPLLIIPVAIFDRSGRSGHYLVKIWARIIIFACGVSVEVKGAENLLDDGSQLLTSNHLEAFDIPVLQGFLPAQFRWVSKKNAFRYPFIGLAMYLSGYIKMDKTHPRAAYKSLQKIADKLKEGVSIIIFPEGTRSKRDSVGEFKRGPFLLAIRTKTPIIPISLRGTERIIERGWPWICPVKVKIFIDSPVYTDGLKDRDASILKNDVHEIISRNFEKLSGL
ncbi:MAG: lysophospholipid acyltransferase family protein [Thermodesulfobacteriota bacterium]